MISDVTIGDRVSAWVTSILIKLAFVLEPLTPHFISIFLSRKLAEWKNKHLIYDYKTRTERIGKFHYKIGLNLDLTPEQARSILRRLMLEMFKRVKR